MIFSAARCHSVDTYVRGCDHSAIAVVVAGGQDSQVEPLFMKYGVSARDVAPDLPYVSAR